MQHPPHHAASRGGEVDDLRLRVDVEDDAFMLATK